MDLAVVRVQPNQLSLNPASNQQQTDRKLFVQNNVSEFNACNIIKDQNTKESQISNGDIKAAPNTAPEIVNAEIIKAAKDNNNSSYPSVHVKRKKT